MQFELGFQQPKKETRLEDSSKELERRAVKGNLSVDVSYQGPSGGGTMRLNADKQQSLAEKLEFWRERYGKNNIQVVKIIGEDDRGNLRKAA